MDLHKFEFTYSACGPFTDTYERNREFKETDNMYVHKEKFDKICLQNDVTYGSSMGQVMRSETDKELSKRTFENANYVLIDGYQDLLASAVYNLFDMKSESTGVVGERLGDAELANQIYKP